MEEVYAAAYSGSWLRSFTGDGICDGVNTLDFRANLAIPQNDNFGVVRIDHDFGAEVALHVELSLLPAESVPPMTKLTSEVFSAAIRWVLRVSHQPSPGAVVPGAWDDHQHQLQRHE